jgi:DNA adenine methylase
MKKSIIRWAGSKRASVDVLLKIFGTNHDRYVEPFCGSASLFFNMTNQEALLSDINNELINFYRTVQRDASSLYDPKAFRAEVRAPDAKMSDA